MQYHQGRLIDHVHIRVADLGASKAFYRAVLESLDLLEAYGEGEGYFYADELFVDETDDRVSSVHLAFQANDADTVHRFHAVALGAGGTDNGRPGPRDYHDGYYGAFVLDPDGNNVEAVWHGPVTRSADSIVIEPSAR